MRKKELGRSLIVPMALEVHAEYIAKVYKKCAPNLQSIRATQTGIVYPHHQQRSDHAEPVCPAVILALICIASTWCCYALLLDIEHDSFNLLKDDAPRAITSWCEHYSPAVNCIAVLSS